MEGENRMLGYNLYLTRYSKVSFTHFTRYWIIGLIVRLMQIQLHINESIYTVRSVLSRSPTSLGYNYTLPKLSTIDIWPGLPLLNFFRFLSNYDRN